VPTTGPLELPEFDTLEHGSPAWKIPCKEAEHGWELLVCSRYDSRIDLGYKEFTAEEAEHLGRALLRAAHLSRTKEIDQEVYDRLERQQVIDALKAWNSPWLDDLTRKLDVERSSGEQDDQLRARALAAVGVTE
jgi:hypothetical protein